jgi:hypothetical protein
MELWRYASYLADPGWAAEVTGDALLGFAILAAVGAFVLVQVSRRCGKVHRFSVVKPMVLGVLLCFGLVVGTQAFGRFTHSIVEKPRQTDGQAERKAPRTRRADKERSPRFSPDGIVFLLWVLVELVLGGWLVAVAGGGYAFVPMDLPIWGHMLAFSFGLGVTEELCKVVVVSLLLHPFIGVFEHRKSLLPFVMAGLIFGSVEALVYFQDYIRDGCEPAVYMIRAYWSVLLHVSWAVISGWFVLRVFTTVPSIKQVWGWQFLDLVMALLPAATLHGVYDAFCLHEQFWGVVIFGIGSLLLGDWILNNHSESGGLKGRRIQQARDC